MNLNTDEGREQLRVLIRSLGEKMRERGDAWLLKDCTTREDSWYNRHIKLQKKKEAELQKKKEAELQKKKEAASKAEDTEKEKESPKGEKSRVCLEFATWVRVFLRHYAGYK